MSVNSVSNPAITPSHPFDTFGKTGIDTVAVPFNLFRDGIKQSIDAITPGEYVHKEFGNETPPISKLAYRVLGFYINWHSNVLINSRQYALGVERLVEKVVKWPFTPITYFDTVASIQKFICETIIGTTVFVIIYLALQIFHVVPYITSVVVITGTYFFYQTAPIALITLLAATSLGLIIYFLYYVAGEVRSVGKKIDAANTTLDVRLSEALQTIKEIQVDAKELKSDALELKSDVKNKALPTILLASAAVLCDRYSYSSLTGYIQGAAAAAIAINFIIPGIQDLWKSRFTVSK